MESRKLKLSAFSTIEVLIALFIVVFGVVISSEIFNSIEKSSARSKELSALISLESNIQVAIEDARNYAPYKVPLKAGTKPARMEFNLYEGSVPRLIALFDNGANVLFYNSALEPCLDATKASNECPFAVHVNVDVTPPQPGPPVVPSVVKVSPRVEKVPGFGKSSKILAGFTGGSDPFIVPNGYIDESKTLKCDSTVDEKYVGMQSLSGKCWSLKAEACGEGSYAQGLKIVAASLPDNPTLELDCVDFFKYECPHDYAPSVFFPINPTMGSNPASSLTGSCVNLKKSKLGPPRLGHIDQAIANVPSSKYGLRWTNVSVCPAGYEPKPVDPVSSKTFVSEFKKSFSIADASTKDPAICSSVTLECGSKLVNTAKPTMGSKYFCDLCPHTNGFDTADGCKPGQKSFSYPGNVASTVDAQCSDPKLIAIDKSFQSEFVCRLQETESVDGQ